MVRARRIVQVACLALSVWLFLGGSAAFFDADPLVLLAAHHWSAALLVSVALLAATALAGRWFCGWICPLGTLHQFAGRFRRSPAAAKVRAGAWHPAQKSKYYLLAGLLAAAWLGINLAGWFDPLAFLFRSLATVVDPALNDAGWALAGRIPSGPAYEFLRRHVLAGRQPHFAGTVTIAVLFAATLALNFVRPRFWCRFLCPLGALLGGAARYSLVRMRVNAAECTECGLCVAECQGGAFGRTGGDWHAAECLYCFNCRDACAKGAASLCLGKPAGEPMDLGRRRVLGSAALGAGAVLVFRTDPLGQGRTFEAALVRPPGSLAEADFLQHCIRCGACLKVCPTNGLQPAALVAGLEGLWTPVFDMKMGYCEYECVRCTEVCPTGAIRALGVAEKQKVRIGLAHFERDRCLPYAYARTCIVCEEHCPTPKKAIWFEEVEVAAGGGRRTTVKQPHIDPELCIGCGICVNKCVLKAAPGVKVTSAGETRHPANGVLLEM